MQVRRRRPITNTEHTDLSEAIVVDNPQPMRNEIVEQSHEIPEEAYRPFELLADDLMVYLLDYLPNNALPASVSQQFARNSFELMKTRARTFITEFKKQNCQLNLQNVNDAITCLKVIADYSYLCVNDSDSSFEKQSKFALLLLMLMQVMHYLTTNKHLTYMLSRGYQEAVILGDDYSTTIEKKTPIDLNDLSAFRTEIERRFLSTELPAPDEASMHNNLDLLVKQASLLRLSVPEQIPSVFSYIFICGIWENPIEKKLVKQSKQCFEKVCNNIGILSKTMGEERLNAMTAKSVVTLAS